MIIVLMGVAGSGKTTVGKRLADSLSWTFLDGDDFHPDANVDKMRAGTALTDADRAEWLNRIGDAISGLLRAQQSAVIACSALKQAYRDTLVSFDRGLRFVYLKGSYEMIRGRMMKRPGHFMPLELLASQFQALEEPKGVLTIEIDQPVDDIVAVIVQKLASDRKESASE